MGDDMSKRFFVKVIINIFKIVKVTLIKLTWPDGCEYQIDHVLDVRTAPAKRGESGIRYSIFKSVFHLQK